jgi:Na+-transporting NADH:ubiquinone oxidoreductase subunit E
MEHMLSLFVRSIFVDNMIFAFFLGMCSYLAVSKNVKTALGLGVAVTFVLCVTVPVDYLLQTKVLAEDGILGMDLTYLAFILFIAVIAGIVQLVEMVVERFSPSLYAALGIFLPLIAVNCAIMGASLFMQQRISMDPATSTQAISSVWDSLAYALGSGIGWLLAIVSLAAIREKMAYTNCILMGRLEAFAMMNGPWESFLNGKRPNFCHAGKYSSPIRLLSISLS